MAYSIQSPNAADDYQIDQYRLNRLGGANLDYQLAAIANEHPDWTPDQVRMAQRGGLGGAPSTRLLTGYGLPARYRITGADPQEQPPISAVNPGPLGANSLQSTFMRQQNAFRLGQISKAQSQLDKLDPSDDDNTTKISELKGRIGALTDETQSNQPAPEPQPSVPMGEGTAGQEAPVYRAGGPAASVGLSNGGNVYFGPVAGAPAFGARPQAAATPAGAAPTPLAQPDYFPGITPPFSIPGPITIGQDSNDSAPVAAPVASVPTAKIALRNKLKGQQNALETDNAPPAEIGSVSNRVYKLDNSITNAPAAFTAGPQDAIANAHPDWTPQQQQLAASGFLKGAAPTAPTIANQADYDALPSGSQYLAPDGSLRTKSAPAPAQ